MTGKNQRDEVDAIIEGWGVQRPDLDPRPLAIFSRLLRLNRHIERIRKSIFAENNLETWEFEMLAALRRQEGSCLTAGRLMQETLVSSGTITNRIDRMEGKGLLIRKADNKDGRVVHVCATEKGIAYVDSAMVGLLQAQAEILEQYDESEREDAADFLRRMLIPFETKAKL